MSAGDVLLIVVAFVVACWLSFLTGVLAGARVEREKAKEKMQGFVAEVVIMVRDFLLNRQPSTKGGRIEPAPPVMTNEQKKV